jgi:hypothetical protein
MNHVIVTIPTAEIRRISRKLLKGNWGIVVAGVFLGMVMMSLIPDFFEACVPFGRITTFSSSVCSLV